MSPASSVKPEEAAAPGPSTYVDVSTLNENPEKKLSGPKSRSHLPECATQQVCNALFVRMNHTQNLCECSRNYNWECSQNPGVDDGHTIELTRRYDKKVYTQVKLCEPLVSVRTCKTPTDWTLLALQSERTGKAHYVVACRCPDSAVLEGPYTHNHPPYARIPGIRVYGMLCAQGTQRTSRNQQATIQDQKMEIKEYPDFPWDQAYAVLNSTDFEALWKN
jgi:hypothetical protein